MKPRDDKPNFELMQLFAVPTRSQLASSRERIRQRLYGQDATPILSAWPVLPDERTAFAISRWHVLATAVLVAVIGLGKYAYDHASLARVEREEGRLSVVADNFPVLARGNRIRQNQPVRSDGGISLLRLADESQVEMRPGSELFLDRADDGLRVELSRGTVIVNAASQLKGHLYVQTKDVTVTVEGTAFLVSVEEGGSRVAVIEGEVRVQYGATDRKLRRGDEVSTGPTMSSITVDEQIDSGSMTAAHVGLPQSTPSTPTSPARAIRPEFETASIKPSNSSGGGGRGGTGGAISGPCSGGYVELDPRRFAVANTTLYTLITMAYRIDVCPNAATTGRLSGGPGWVGEDQWDIEALIPIGTPNFTQREFNSGEAPPINMMLQNLLEDRFKLVLRRAQKEMSAYVLSVDKDRFKLVPSRDHVVPSTAMGPRVRNGQASVGLNSNRMSMARLAGLLGAVTGGKPVLDRTNLDGEFNIDLAFVPPDLSSPLMIKSLPASGPSLFSALDEVGLKLEATKATVESWVIADVEKPSKN
jgi:uncharacterized protein (TIGR03435 family)